MKENKYKVYLASPFFNQEQLERIQFVERILDNLHYNTFSPRKESLITSNSTQSDMIRTFNGNISNIDDCDFVLAILDAQEGINYSDSGTVFEVGYAYSKNKPILIFNETRDKAPNLMLAMAGQLPFITKTTNKLEDIFNYQNVKRIETIHESIDYKRTSLQRSLLYTTLKIIKNESLEKAIEYSRFSFKEVE